MGKARNKQMVVTAERGVTEVTRSFLDDDGSSPTASTKGAKKDKKPVVRVPVKEMLPVVSLLTGFTAERDLVSGLKQLWFQGRTVRTSAGSAGAVHETSWEFPGEFALSAAHFHRIVSSLSDQGCEELVLELREGRVGVAGGGFRASLPMYKPGDGEDPSLYLRRERQAAGPKVALTPAWWDEVERVMFTVCRDETKAPLCGVYWSEGGLLLSTDTFRISALNPPKDARVGAPKGGLVLPSHMLDRLGGRRRDASSAHLEGDSTLWFQLGDAAAVYGSLLAAGFPTAGFAGALKQVRENARGGTWVTLGTGVLAALDRLLYFAAGPTFRVDGQVLGDGVHLVVTEGGTTAEETVPATVAGPPAKFAVNGKFFKDAVAAVGPRFWIDPATNNAAYFVSADKRFEHLVMLLA